MALCVIRLSLHDYRGVIKIEDRMTIAEKVGGGIWRDELGKCIRGVERYSICT